MKYFLIFICLLPVFIQAQPAWNLKPLDFFKIPEEKDFGETMGVAVNSHQHVFVFHRGPGSLMEFDENGSFIKTFGEGLFKKPHGLRVDRHDNIWITDGKDGYISQLDQSGKVIAKYGQHGKAIG